MVLMRLIRHHILKNHAFFENICAMNLYSTSAKNAYFLLSEGSDNFQVSFKWSSEEMKVDREFNFNRKLDEDLNSFFGRIKTNIDKLVEKKLYRKSKKKETEETVKSWEGVTVKAIVDGQSIPGSTKCSCFFEELESKKVQLNILNDYYDVVVNPPIVESIQLPTCIMVGFPVYPSKISLAFGHRQKSSFIWWREENPRKWIEVGSGFVYLPSVEDLNCKIKVECVPSDGIKTGPPAEAESKEKVQAGPGHCPFETRHNFTKEVIGNDGFRVVSYNILADLYAETQAAKTELFPYCPPYAMALDYRKHLILREILGYNGDILCLQEVGKRLFENDLTLVLSDQGLEGVFAVKKDISEGVATFFSTSKFRLIQDWRLVLCDEINTNPLFTHIWERIKDNEELTKNFCSRATVVQVLLLESLHNGNEKLIVANTHLYFSPSADHIRLLQCAMAIEFLKDIIGNLSKSNPQDKYSIVLCGDFNSTPECGIYEYVTKKFVPSDYPEWKAKEGEFVEGLELRHPFALASACGTPKYTNFTVGFSDCLDYIFYQADLLLVEQVVPFPSEEELQQHIAIPSVVFPSDHIALVADLKWK